LRSKESMIVREAFFTSHKSGKDYKSILNKYEVHHSTVRTFNHNGHLSKFTPKSGHAMLRETTKNSRGLTV
uniref:Uncharacterized protein n=1 Tax=Pundamilia nyererei TaxID=303518 RepID=A0A3B4FAI0_9CICH